LRQILPTRNNNQNFPSQPKRSQQTKDAYKNTIENPKAPEASSKSSQATPSTHPTKCKNEGGVWS